MSESQLKYRLAVGAIFKNESHILEEWITHYLKEGVEHFFLINNGSTDTFMDTINKYSYCVTLFNDDKRHAQAELYNKYVMPQKDKTEWVIVCDLDEFIYSRIVNLFLIYSFK